MPSHREPWRPAAVASALALVAAAAGAVRAGAQAEAPPMALRMPLRIDAGARFAYAVRRNGWDPLAGRAVGRDGDPPAPIALRFELVALEVSAESGARFELALSPLAQEGGAREPLRFQVRVARDGRVQRVEPASEAASAGELPPAELRAVLGAIFGGALHEGELAPGEARALDAGEAARDRLGFGRVRLRYEGERESGGRKLRAFTLFLPTDAEGSAVGRRAGEAAYLARDGLLSKLSFQPCCGAAEEREHVNWLHVERIQDGHP